MDLLKSTVILKRIGKGFTVVRNAKVVRRSSFVYTLIPPRSTFIDDMTAEERAIMPYGLAIALADPAVLSKLQTYEIAPMLAVFCSEG